jgi:hypothetical protein
MKRTILVNAAPPASAAVLMAMGIAVSAHAAAALNGHIAVRPLTPQEQKTTGLPTPCFERSDDCWIGTAGLPGFAGRKAFPSADITNVVWSLTSAPFGSKAALAESPLANLRFTA